VALALLPASDHLHRRLHSCHLLYNHHPIDYIKLIIGCAGLLSDHWIDLGKALSESLRENSEFRSMKFAHDHLRVQCIIPKRSKSKIDEVDIALAEYFELTQQQLDFIINYDVKYRMGQGAEDADD
jgi:hypothetical protein